MEEEVQDDLVIPTYSDATPWVLKNNKNVNIALLGTLTSEAGSKRRFTNGKSGK